MDARIHYLVTRYFEGSCTQAEQEELAEWISRADSDDMLKAELEQAWQQYEPDETMKSLADPALNKIAARLFGREQVDSNIVPLRRRFRPWMAAAVLLLLIAGAGAYFLFLQPKPSELASEVVQRYKNDVPPGGNRATLTLSNGTVIFLDSAHNGQLASQGSSKVIKMNNGILTYQAAREELKAGSRMSYNTLATPRGGQYQLVLPDGSLVWLNAASSIRYPIAFTGHERVVEVTGEAYFEVVHDDGIPFKVKVGNEVVEDIGTHFNINAYSDEPATNITLLEGGITVTKNTPQQQQLTLQPGQQAKVSRNEQMNLISNVDMDEVVAWKNGKFSFHHTSIYEVMRQIARWYDVDVNYRDSLDIYLTGGIRKDVNVSEVFRMLELVEKRKVKFSIEGRMITVMQ